MISLLSPPAALLLCARGIEVISDDHRRPMTIDVLKLVRVALSRTGIELFAPRITSESNSRQFRDYIYCTSMRHCVSSELIAI